MRPSIGTVGDAYDNPMAKSFFASLKCEMNARRSWKSRGWWSGCLLRRVLHSQNLDGASLGQHTIKNDVVRMHDQFVQPLGQARPATPAKLWMLCKRIGLVGQLLSEVLGPRRVVLADVAPSCYLEPFLQSGEANIYLIGNVLLREGSALTKLMQRLFFEFWIM